MEQPFFRSLQSLSQSRNSLLLMEPECSSLCSQEPANGHYPEPGEYSPHLPSLFPQDTNIILPSIPRSFTQYLLFRFTNKNSVCISYIFHACYMSCPSYNTWLHHCNIIWWSIQVTKLIMQSFPASCHFLPLKSIFSSAPCLQTPSIYVRLEVFTVMKIQVEVFWVITLCSAAVGYQCYNTV